MLSSAARVNIVLRQCSTRTNGVDVHVRSKANYYLQPWYILAYLFCKKKILVNCRLHWLTRSGRSQGRQQNSFHSFHLWAPRKAPVRIGSNKKDTFLRRDVWSIYYTLFFYCWFLADRPEGDVSDTLCSDTTVLLVCAMQDLVLSPSEIVQYESGLL